MPDWCLFHTLKGLHTHGDVTPTEFILPDEASYDFVGLYIPFDIYVAPIQANGIILLKYGSPVTSCNASVAVVV